LTVSLRARWSVPSRDKKPSRHPLRSRFGVNVAQLRKRRGLSQEKLAEKIERSLRYTQSIEAGEYWPALPTLALLKKALKCSWDELLAGT
jgi:transcriptional regulator with XRE-family HTH domain